MPARRKKPPKTIVIPAAVVQHVKHAVEARKPVTRELEETDAFTLVVQESGGEYNIISAEEEEAISGIETYGEMAKFLGLSYRDLCTILKRRGYGQQPEGRNDCVWDPFDVADLLADLKPWPTVKSLFDGMPWTWLDESGEVIGGLSVTPGARPGDSTEFVWVDSLEEVGYLQWVLDKFQRRVHLSMGNY